MRILIAFILSLALAFASVFPAGAATRTEGILKLQEMANRFKSSVTSFNTRKAAAEVRIKQAYDAMLASKQAMIEAPESQKAEAQARALRDTAAFLKENKLLFEAATAEAGRLLGQLEDLKEAVRNSGLGQAREQVDDPEFRNEVNRFTGVLANQAKLLSGDAKSMVAHILGNTRQIYSETNTGLPPVVGTKSLEKLTAHMEMVYVDAKIGLRRLARAEEANKQGMELVYLTLAMAPVNDVICDLGADLDMPSLDMPEQLMLPAPIMIAPSEGGADGVLDNIIDNGLI